MKEIKDKLLSKLTDKQKKIVEENIKYIEKNECEKNKCESYFYSLDTRINMNENVTTFVYKCDLCKKTHEMSKV